jgi:hypothetical protein
MLDLDHPNWLPFNDPVNQLVHSEDGTAVASVMIGGRLVVDNRRVLTVDLERLRDRVEAARERLAAANADNRRLYEALEPVVGSYAQVSRGARTTSTATARGWSSHANRRGHDSRFFPVHREFSRYFPDNRRLAAKIVS